MANKMKMKELVGKLSIEQMRQILIERMSSDPALEALLLQRYDKQKDLKTFQRMFVLAKSKIDEDSYFGFENCYDFIEEVEIIVEEARSSISAGRVELGLSIFFMLIEEITKLLEDGDDHDGSLVGALQDWIAEITKIAAGPKIDYSDLTQIIAWASAAIEKGWASTDSSRKSDCRQLIVAASRDKTGLSKALEFALREVSAEDQKNNHEYHIEQAVLEALDLYKKLQDIKKRSELFKKFLKFDRVRLLLIDEELAAGNLDEAKSLVMEGYSMRDDSYGRFGKDHFARLLVDIHQKQGNIEAAKAVELEMFFSTWSVDYWYAQIKKRHKSTWVSYREELISLVIYKKIPKTRLAEIYKKEKMVERLSALCESKNDLYMEYFSIVGKLYPDRVSAWWKNKIERKCTQAAERKVYQEIARWFSLFARYSSKEKAEQLKETILKRYPNRPAMKQEFARIRIKV